MNPITIDQKIEIMRIAADRLPYDESIKDQYKMMIDLIETEKDDVNKAQ